MKMIPIGIYDEDGDALCLMKASDFSDRNYEGIQLRKTKKGMKWLGFRFESLRFRFVISAHNN